MIRASFGNIPTKMFPRIAEVSEFVAARRPLDMEREDHSLRERLRNTANAHAIDIRPSRPVSRRRPTPRRVLPGWIFGYNRRNSIMNMSSG